MKTILVPTDFSRPASNAMNYALDLAAHTKAEVYVLHVVFPNEGVDNNIYNAFWSEEYLGERKKALEQWLKTYRRKVAGRGVKLRGECWVGFPVASIIETAQNEKVDMILMGTTGATGLRGVALGSVAAGVLGKTKVPVLVIPPRVKYRHPAGHAVLATDFRLRLNEHDLSILQQVLDWQNGDLKVVHILSKPGEHPDRSGEERVSEKLGNIKHDYHYIHDRDVAQAVSNFIEATDAAALVAVRHEHSMLHRLFFDSTARKLAHRARVPMLVLHDAM